MTFRIPIRSRGPIVACALLGACSSSAPTPATYVTASLGPMTSNSALCSMSQRATALTIGAPTGVKPTVVPDMGMNLGGIVNVQCKVSAASGGFDLTLVASTGAASAAGGSLSVTGHVDSSGQGTGAYGVINSNSTNWTSCNNMTSMGMLTCPNVPGCTITATYGGGPVPTSPVVTAGRVWGHISCPSMVPDNGNRVTIMGVTQLQQCDGEADFLFENCSN